MKIDLSVYRNEHGKNPRGGGLWIASVYAEGRGSTELSYTGSWSDARIRFINEAKSIGGASKITLQP